MNRIRIAYLVCALLGVVLSSCEIATLAPESPIASATQLSGTWKLAATDGHDMSSAQTVYVFSEVDFTRSSPAGAQRFAFEEAGDLLTVRHDGDVEQIRFSFAGDLLLLESQGHLAVLERAE